MDQIDDGQLLDTLIQRLHIGLLVFQHDKVRFANDVVAHILGFQSHIDLLGHPYHSLFREELPPGPDGTWLILGISSRGRTLPLTVDCFSINLKTGPVTCLLMTNMHQHESQYEQLLVQANYDELTGLPNRNLFNDRFKYALAKADRKKSHLALMFIDLVQFKRVNDTFGHTTGDALLQKLAVRLTGAIRVSDTVARLSGDEFVVLLEDVPDPNNAERNVEMVATKIVNAISQPIKLKHHTVQVGASIGIALYPKDGTVPETLIHHADLAMYRAKANGGSNIQFYSNGSHGSSRATG